MNSGCCPRPTTTAPPFNAPYRWINPHPSTPPHLTSPQTHTHDLDTPLFYIFPLALYMLPYLIYIPCPICIHCCPDIPPNCYTSTLTYLLPLSLWQVILRNPQDVCRTSNMWLWPWKYTNRIHEWTPRIDKQKGKKQSIRIKWIKRQLPK